MATQRKTKDPLQGVTSILSPNELRNLLQVVWDQNAVTMDQFALFAGLPEPQAEKLGHDLARATLAHSTLVINGEKRWVWIREDGPIFDVLLDAVPRHKPVQYRSFFHWSAINNARLLVELYPAQLERLWQKVGVRPPEFPCEFIPENVLWLEANRSGELLYVPDGLVLIGGKSVIVEAELSVKPEDELREKLAFYEEQHHDAIVYFASPAVCKKFAEYKLLKSHPKLVLYKVDDPGRGLRREAWRIPGDPAKLPGNRNWDREREALTDLERQALNLYADQHVIAQDQLERFLAIGEDEAEKLVSGLVMSGLLFRAKPLVRESVVAWPTGPGLRLVDRDLSSSEPSLGGLELARAINEVRLYVTRDRPDIVWVSGREIRRQTGKHGSVPHGAIEFDVTRNGVVKRHRYALQVVLSISDLDAFKERVLRRFEEKDDKGKPKYNGLVLFYPEDVAPVSSQIQKFKRDYDNPKLEIHPLPNSELAIAPETALRPPVPARRRKSPERRYLAPYPRKGKRRPRKPSGYRGPRARSTTKSKQVAKPRVSRGSRDYWEYLEERKRLKGVGVPVRQMGISALQAKAFKAIAEEAEDGRELRIITVWRRYACGPQLFCVETNQGVFGVLMWRGQWNARKLEDPSIFEKSVDLPLILTEEEVARERKVAIERSEAELPLYGEVTDKQWQELEPFVPVSPQPFGATGRNRRVSDRAVLSVLLHVLRDGIPLNQCKCKEMGYCSHSNIRRHLRTWEQLAGWDQFVEAMERILPDGRELKWGRLRSKATTAAADRKLAQRIRDLKKAGKPMPHQVSDSQWEKLEPLVPPYKRDGRQKATDRDVVNALYFTLNERIPMTSLPLELGYGVPGGIRTRIAMWRERPEWDRFLSALMELAPNSDQLDWSLVTSPASRAKRLHAVGEPVIAADGLAALPPEREISDALWEELEAYFPHPAGYSNVGDGRRKASDKDFVNALLYGLYTGLPWSSTPANLKYCSSSTLRSRLARWKKLQGWCEFVQILAEKVPDGDRLAWSRLLYEVSPQRSQPLAAVPASGGLGTDGKYETTDEAWAELAPKVPQIPYSSKPGVPRIPDREIVSGFLFVVREKVPVSALPEELGYGAYGVIASRLREWRKLPEWDGFIETLRKLLPDGDELDLSRWVGDGVSPELEAALRERREAGMPADYEISDAIWIKVRHKLPRELGSLDERDGRRSVSDQAAVSGFLFVMRYGIPWGHLPRELNYGSPSWVRMRFVTWQEMPGWHEFIEALKEALPYADEVDWDRIYSDASSTERRRKETKRPSRVQKLADSGVELVELPPEKEIGDELWAELKPAFPSPDDSGIALWQPSDQDFVNSLLYALHANKPWGKLPPGLKYCSSSILCRRLHKCRKLEGWEEFVKLLSEKAPHGDRLDWSRLTYVVPSNPRKPLPAIPASGGLGLEEKYEMTDEVWAQLAPRVPKIPGFEKPGGVRIPDREIVSGILFVLRHRVSILALPEELGYGSRGVVSARLREWRNLEGWTAFVEALKELLPDGDRIDWSRLETKHDLSPEVEAAISERREAGLPVDFEISDSVWAEVWPKLPRAENSFDEEDGRRSVSDRAIVSGFLFVLRYELPWGSLPRELDYGSPNWVRLRVRAWQKLPGWQEFIEALKEKLPYGDQLDWSRVLPGGC